MRKKGVEKRGERRKEGREKRLKRKERGGEKKRGEENGGGRVKKKGERKITTRESGVRQVFYIIIFFKILSKCLSALEQCACTKVKIGADFE